MKKTLYYIVILTLSFSEYGQDNSIYGHINVNIDHALNKINKVKSIKSFECKNKNTKRGKLLTHKLYDTTGNLVEEFAYYSDEFHQKYEYNVKGYLSKEIGYVLNSPVETFFLYKYDEQGRIIEKTVDHAPLFTDIFYYSYDSKGNVGKIKWLMMGADKKTNLLFTDTFEYNSNNRLVKMIRLRPDASIYFYKTYQYDSIGNLSSEVRFEKNIPTDVWEYRYDINNNCVEKEWFDKVGKGHALSKTNYNERGLVMSRPSHKGFINYFYEYYD